MEQHDVPMCKTCGEMPGPIMTIYAASECDGCWELRSRMRGVPFEFIERLWKEENAS